jgi:CHASE2 domain-containing sensor protein/signal transduction histidine kinase
VTARPALRRRRDDALIAAVLAALALWLALGGFAWRGDRVLHDLALGWWARPAPPDIVIVAIDDASVEAIGRWPWPRTVHATLLERLAAAEPKAILLDLLLSEPDPAGDPWLADALARAAPVVMPVAWQATGGQLSVLYPTPALRVQAAALGAAESTVDADGVVRHLFLSAGPADAPYPHLALALLHAGGDRLHRSLLPQADPADAAQPPAGWRRDGRLHLRFAGPPGSVPRVSYVDVLQGRVPADALAGRYLLVGMTAQGLGDTLATPVNAHHRAMPGVEVLANAVALLRDGHGLRSVAPAAEGAASALALVALVFGFRRLGARRALPLALLSVPVVAAASVLSVGAGWLWSPLSYALPALLAYPLWSWRRLEHAVQVLDREIRRLAVEPAGQAPAGAAVESEDADPLARRLDDLARAGLLLREARSFLAGTLERLPTAMLVGDAHGRVALANARAAALFEVTHADELAGLDLRRLIGEFAPAEALDWAQALAALRPDGPALSVEARLGREECLLHVAAVELAGQSRWIVSVADLAPVREAQRQREQTLAFVSHDLRGPANSMLMLTTLARQGRSPLPAERLLDELQRLASRTLALADDFVRAARAETHPLSLSRVTPADLVEDGLADARVAASAAGVSLAVRVEAGATALVLDRALAVRALANLASNAIRHAPAGSAVRVQAWRDPAGLCVEVADEGPGLAPDQQTALQRGEDMLRVGGVGGVGLGLVFVRRVARRHGGSLVATPGLQGRGTCMTLRLADQQGTREAAGSGIP